MPATDWGWLVDPAELRAWIVREDADFLVVNKPGGVVCIPAKHGPHSCLAGAVRAYLGTAAHMAWRLDRETSGAMLFAKRPDVASRVQRAVEGRLTHKTYHAILVGRLDAPVVVDRPLGRDAHSEIAVRQAVLDGPEGKPSVTEFIPLAHAGGFTLVRAHPRTGRLHQIRVHARHLGVPVVGDKLYGPDPALYLEFIRTGWTEELRARLLLPRHALHCSEVVLDAGWTRQVFAAPWPEDLRAFWESVGGRADAVA